eukprot:4030545-Pyramimonas_sp.AAC.1
MKQTLKKDWVIAATASRSKIFSRTTLDILSHETNATKKVLGLHRVPTSFLRPTPRRSVRYSPVAGYIYLRGVNGEHLQPLRDRRGALVTARVRGPRRFSSIIRVGR